MKGLQTQAGTSMEDAQVFLTDPVTKAIKFNEQTDSPGKFDFKYIAFRKYGFMGEYQGKSFEMPQDIDLSQENSTVEVTAVVSESGVSATVEQITGIKEDRKPGMLLYPNPLKDKLIILLEEYSPGPMEILVFDGQGKVLKIEKVQVSGGAFREEVDFSDLPNGLYLISLKQFDKELYRKIVKQ